MSQELFNMTERPPTFSEIENVVEIEAISRQKDIQANTEKIFDTFEKDNFPEWFQKGKRCWNRCFQSERGFLKAIYFTQIPITY